MQPNLIIKNVFCFFPALFCYLFISFTLCGVCKEVLGKKEECCFIGELAYANVRRQPATLCLSTVFSLVPQDGELSWGKYLCVFRQQTCQYIIDTSLASINHRANKASIFEMRTHFTQTQQEAEKNFKVSRFSERKRVCVCVWDDRCGEQQSCERAGVYSVGCSFVVKRDVKSWQER